MINLIPEERLSLEEYIHDFFVEWSKDKEGTLDNNAMSSLEQKISRQMKQYIHARFFSD